jgi:hypothetical protein
MLTPWRVAFGTFSNLSCHPCGGFRHAAFNAASKIAAGAPIAWTLSQAKRTKVKLEKNIFKNKYALCQVEMCEQCYEIIKSTLKSRETIPLNVDPMNKN